MPPEATATTDQNALAGVLDELDLSIDETVFSSPGEEIGVQPIEAWTTVGTSCWSCKGSCTCSDTCTISCNC